MFVFSAFSPKELEKKILEIQKLKDRHVVSVSLEFNEETNMDMIIFNKDNNDYYVNSLLSFGKENTMDLEINEPIAVDVVEIGDRGEQYIFIEQLKEDFVSKPFSLSKKVLV